ncbi:MAG: HupE/UreJ family protein, partial [Calditrichaeota bacterium]
MINHYRKILVFILFLMGNAASAEAHQMMTGYLSIELTPDTLKMFYSFDLTDLERVFALDANQNHMIEKQEILGQMETMIGYFDSRTAVRLDYLPVHLRRLEPGMTRDKLGNVFVHFKFQKSGIGAPGRFNLQCNLFEDFGRSFKILVKIHRPGRLEQYVMTAATPALQLELNEAGPGLLRQMWAFLQLGIEHIFLGFDHIAFLFGLLIIGGAFVDLVKIVSSFTVAHSFTLILAALQWVNLSTRLVESAIALSIIFIAVENFYIKSQDKRWIVTGLFGFVHGFGFANVLADLGLPKNGLIPSLLSFNLGVEVGQVAIVLVILPLVWG